MHVMFIPSWYSSKSNKVHGSFFKEQALELQDKGIKVTIAYNEIWPITSIGKVSERRGLNIDVEDNLKTYRFRDYNYLPKNPLMFKAFNRRMDKLYKSIVKNEGKIDIIHAHSSMWGGIAAAYISQKYNIPLIITEHSSVERGPYVRESYLPYIINSYKSANCIITVGNGLKKEIEKLSGREDIIVIGNMINFDKFQLKDKCENEEFIFFSLGFLEGEKCFDLLIRSFSKEFKDRGGVLYIGGAGSQREGLERIAKDEGISKKVKFLGALSREEVSFWMKKADAFVLPSRYETFGVVYIEALASGTPVIGALNGGAEDIIESTNGYIVPTDNRDALAEAMVNMVENKEGFKSEILRGSCYKRFSPNVIADKIISVYKEILKKDGV